MGGLSFNIVTHNLLQLPYCDKAEGALVLLLDSILAAAI